jgi:hypothetical protein
MALELLRVPYFRFTPIRYAIAHEIPNLGQRAALSVQRHEVGKEIRHLFPACQRSAPGKSSRWERGASGPQKHQAIPPLDSLGFEFGGVSATWLLDAVGPKIQLTSLMVLNPVAEYGGF